MDASVVLRVHHATCHGGDDHNPAGGVHNPEHYTT